MDNCIQVWSILSTLSGYSFEHIEFHQNLGNIFRHSFFISFTMSNVKIPMAIGCSWVTLNIKESLCNGLLKGNLIRKCCQPISPFNLFIPFTKS
jgi:hypothetical protein